MNDMEARQLAKRAQRGDLEARDALVVECEPLTRLVAREWSRSFPGGGRDYATTWDDLRQECYIALLECIGRYDVDGPVPFLSYARHRMRASVFNLLKFQVRRRRRVEKAERLGCLVPEAAEDPLEVLMRKRAVAWAYAILNHYRADGSITNRQYTILRGAIAGKTRAQLEQELGCSRWTIGRELKAVRRVLANEDI